MQHSLCALFGITLCACADTEIAFMQCFNVSKSKDKPPKRKTKVQHHDPLSKQHSKRHGHATKKGIRTAKERKHAVLKAASIAKGKKRAVVEADFFHGTSCRPKNKH